MKNIVFFDLETQKSAAEVGGWERASDMLMSVGVTYSTKRESYMIYDERHVQDLIRELQRADLVVGYNHIGFDYKVLQPYCFFDLCLTPSLDILDDIKKHVAHRVALDDVAKTTIGVEKTAEGMQALTWYRQGKMMEIAEYCCYDVKITKLVYEFGVKYKKIFFTNRFGEKITIPVSWTMG